MSSEEIQDIQEISEIHQEFPQEIPENQENPSEIPEIQENKENPQEIPGFQENKNEECTDVAPLVPKRGRGRPKGAKNRVKIMTVDADIPSVTLNEEPATIKKPRVTKRTQPDPTPERRVPEHADAGTTLHQMMLSLHEIQKQRTEAKRMMYRNMIA